MTAKREGYFKMDNNIIDNHELPFTLPMQAVYICLSRYANNSTAFPSHATIAKGCRMHRATVNKAIKKLEEGGYITVIRGDDSDYNSNTYIVNPLPAAPSKKRKRGKKAITLSEPESVSEPKLNQPLKPSKKPSVISANHDRVSAWREWEAGAKAILGMDIENAEDVLERPIDDFASEQELLTIKKELEKVKIKV